MRVRAWAGLAAALVVLAIALGLASGDDRGPRTDPSSATATDSARATETAIKTPAASPSTPSAPALLAGPDAAASPNPGASATTGLGAEELQELRAEMAAHPKGEAEFQRVVGFLSFSRQWEAFQQARQGGADPAAVRSLAQALDDTLPARWQNHELTGPQALQIKARLLEVLVADESSRQAALMQWREQHPPRVRLDPAESQFLEEQARVVAAWRAQPATQRQPAGLQAQLDALRVKSFAGTKPPTIPEGRAP